MPSPRLKIWDFDGNLKLDTDETFTREVYSQRVDWNFTGKISVPDFDDTKGAFYVSYYLVKFDHVDGVQYPDGKAFEQVQYLNLMMNPQALPTLNWNNSTKKLSCTPFSLPSGWLWVGNVRPDYRVTFFHYR